MFISYKKGMKTRRPESDISLRLRRIRYLHHAIVFSPANLVWMEMGGIYAVANLRGGGEYGEKWHEAGMLHVKQNVFDDFIAAAQYLIDNKYTSTPKLAIGGGSNGGLAGRRVPDPTARSLRRHAAGGRGDGHAAVREVHHRLGLDFRLRQRAETRMTFAYLYAYSPLHHIAKDCCYPSTLITTADHDDRVVPAHSFKFAATLQAAQGCDKPTLIRIETKAGHGAGKPTTKIIDETADRWAFLVKELGMKIAK